MGMRVAIGLLACVLAALPARAQETRGNINGVVQDQGGVVPGATVRITNINTSQTQHLVTNATGYFEAPLLNPGNYEVSVELQGFKTLTQTGIALAVGQTLSLSLTLEVGQITEEITVTAESPLIDTTTVSSGQNFDRRMVEALPMFSNMPIMLSRLTPGVAPAEAEVQNIFQGYMEGTTNAAGGQVGTGSGFDSRNTGNNYTIDGAAEQRLRPPHRQLAQRRPDRRDAHRDVELRRLAGARHGAHHLDDDARRHERAARLGQLHALEQPGELAQPAAEGHVRARTRARRMRGVRAASTSAPSRSAARSSSRKSSMGAARCSSSPTTRCRTTRRRDAWPARPPFQPTGSTSRAISPTCCCCRRAPGPPRQRATISTRSSIR